MFICMILVLYFVLFSFNHIQDTNGKLTNLVTIDIEEEIKKEVTLYKSNYSTLRCSGGSTGIKGELKEVDRDTIKYSTKKISGVKTLQATLMNNGESLSIKVNSNLTMGNLVIVIVDSNNNIIKEVTLNEEEIVNITSTEEGIYKVICGAESAKFDVVIQRSKK